MHCYLQSASLAIYPISMFFMPVNVILAAAYLLHYVLATAAPKVAPRALPAMCWDLCNDAELEYRQTGACGDAYRDYYEACKCCAEKNCGDMDGWPWRCP